MVLFVHKKKIKMSRRAERKIEQEENENNYTEISNISTNNQVNSLSNATIPVNDNLKPITRKYAVTFESSLNELANNEELAVWTPDIGSQHIFQSRTRYSSAPNVKKVDVPQGNLKNALLIGMEIKKMDSNFPCEIGVKIDGAKGNYYMANGERFAYHVFPQEKSYNLNEVVVTTNPYINSEYLRAFPGMTGDKLTQNIISVPNENYCYVDQRHPVIEMIKENKETLQLDIDDDDLVDERFFKVNSSVVENCIDRLKDELHDNLPLIDLTDFKVSIQRPYNCDWDDTSGPCDNVMSDSKRDMIMDATRRFSFILEMTYAFA